MGMSRRAVLTALAGAGASALGASFGYGFWFGRRALDVTRARVPVEGLPVALSGLRVGLLTDVHRSRWVAHEDVTRAVDALMAEQPDLIVLGGDYVTWGDRRFVEPSAEALDRLSAPFGVFGILGNHDNDHDMPPPLIARGIQVLRDARTTLVVKGETIELIGIRFWTRRESDIASLMRGAIGFPI